MKFIVPFIQASLAAIIYCLLDKIPAKGVVKKILSFKSIKMVIAYIISMIIFIVMVFAVAIIMN